MTEDFAPFRALSFDCYGTLIDWERGITQAMRPWARRQGLKVSDSTLLKLFSAYETAVQTEHPTMRYPDVLGEVLRRIGQRLRAGVSPADVAAFGASVGDWPAFPDTADALHRLGSRFALIILSNVDRQSFARSNRHLGVDFDRIITAEDVGSYKPSARNFEALLETVAELGLTRDQLLHVAESLYHDHEPAHEFGIASVWIHRRHAVEGVGATPPPRGDTAPRWRFESMAGLADAAGV